jgi:hypothetical protein
LLPGGGDDGYDQVPRLQRFRGAHPEWTIWLDREAGLWRASRSGRPQETRLELRWLLDALEGEDA